MCTVKLETLTFRAHPAFEGYLAAQNEVAMFVYHRAALEQMVDYEVTPDTTVTLGDGTVFEVYQATDEDGDKPTLMYCHDLGLTTTGVNEIYQAASVEELVQRVPVVHGTLEQYVAILAGL